MSNNIKLTIVSGILIILAGVLLWGGMKGRVTDQIQIPVSPKPAILQPPGPKPSSESAKLDSGLQFGTAYKVTKVVDGDTIEVDINGVLTRVRYIGVNTPETVDPRRPVQCFGKEASDENKSLVSGKSVYFERDVSDTDKYGRLLRYVYFKLDDGSFLFVNDYLVRQGYAQVSTYPPDVKYTERFVEAQKQAQQGKHGLWQKCKS